MDELERMKICLKYKTEMMKINLILGNPVCLLLNYLIIPIKKTAQECQQLSTLSTSFTLSQKRVLSQTQSQQRGHYFK